MNRLREVERESFRYCDETCPAVESAFLDAIAALNELIAPNLVDEMKVLMDSLCERVKYVGTIKLRDALKTCIEEKQVIESDFADKEEEIKRLEQQVEELQAYSTSLESELSSMHA